MRWLPLLSERAQIFSRSRELPKSLLQAERDCWSYHVGGAILRAPFLIPSIVLESDTCLAIRHPKPHARIHYVLFPKHDTKDITTLTPVDSPYVLGCFALARDLVLRDKLQAYRLYTNGPELQEIAYLHFHLIAE